MWETPGRKAWEWLLRKSREQHKGVQKRLRRDGKEPEKSES